MNTLSLPTWLYSGVKFRDPSGDKCIYLGSGSFREAVPVSLTIEASTVPGPGNGSEKFNVAPVSSVGLYTLVFRPKNSHPMVCLYNGSWFMWELFSSDHDQNWFDNLKEGW